MKQQIIISIFALLVNAITTWAQAGSEVINFAEQNLENAAAVTSINGTGCTISFTKASYYTNGSAVRVYGGGTMTVSVNHGLFMEQVKLTLAGGGNANPVTVSTGSMGADFVWTGNARELTFTVGGSTGHRRIQSVELTYSAGVPKPSINGQSPFLRSTEVSIAAEDGARVYYTTDGTTPNEQSSLYASPFTIYAATTVKAIAVKDGKSSNVAERHFAVSLPFSLITDIEQLTDGCQVCFVGMTSSTTYAMGAQDETNRMAIELGSVPADLSTLAIAGGQCVALVGKSGDGYTFYDVAAGGYLMAVSSAYNYMHTGELCADAYATVTVGANGEATIAFGNNKLHNNLRFNYNNGSPVFSCYSSSSENVKKVYLYKLAAAEEEWSGDGTASSPYLIATAAQLNLLASRVNGGNSYAGVYFQLTRDLAYSGTNNYTAIGTAEHPFCGIFDGRGFAVSGIDGAYALFGTIGTDGQVTNLLWLDATPAKAYLAGNSYADVYTITSGTQGLNVALRSGTAIAHGSAIYAPAGAEIGITLSLANDGGVLGEVKMNAETLDGSGAERTLTMPNGNAVITADLSNTWSGEGTATSPYIITTAAGWDQLCEKVNAGETFSGKFFQLGNHISVTTMAGTSEANSFQGTFDGQGQTLTFTADVSTSVCAPFAWVKNATIRGLHTAGSITTSAQFAAGIVGRAFGNTSLTACRSSVTINSTHSGDGSHAGLVSIVNHYNGSGRYISHLTLENCLFDGKLLTTNGTNSCGGFIAYNHGNGVVMNNCLFNPQEVSAGMGESTLIRKGTGEVTITNTYYKTTFGGTDGQGELTNKTGDDLKSLLGAGWEKITENDATKVVPIMTTTTLEGDGTAELPYLIASAADWNILVHNVNAIGERYAEKHFQLTAGITINTTLGTEGTPFSGIFDGNGNTLTAALNDTDHQGTAPFRYISGATIMNLKVNGTVTGSTHAAGLVGFTWSGENTIDGCTVSTAVSVPATSGYRHVGGIVGHGKKATLNLRNCTFNGTMSNTGDYAGGMLGWSDGSVLNIFNTIYDGTYTGGGKFHPVAVRSYNENMSVNTTYCVYTVAPTLTDENYIAATGFRVYKNLSDVEGNGLYLLLQNDETPYYGTVGVQMKDHFDLTGNIIHPKPTVTVAGNFVVPQSSQGQDYYTLTYSPENDAQAGNYTVTITGVSIANGTHLAGSKTLNYTVAGDGLLTDINIPDDQIGHYYVQMPDYIESGTATNTINIPDATVTAFKVYDDGGKNGPYSDDYEGMLILKAPEGYRLRLTGTIALEAKYDELSVYDGDDDLAPTLVDELSGGDQGDPLDIGIVETTGCCMTLYLDSDGETVCDGLNLTVTLIAPHVPYSLAAVPSTTSATLSWEGVADEYKVEYRKAGSDGAIYYNEFEGEIPAGWTTIDADGDGYGWCYYKDYTTRDLEGHSGYGFMASGSYQDNKALTPDNWLISPQLTLNGTMKVWLRAYSDDYPHEHFAIYASTTGTAVEDFTTVLVPETVVTDEYAMYTADLAQFAGKDGYIAIRHFNCSDQFALFLDDFGIYGVPVEAGEWQELNVTEKSTTVTGLTDGTEYEFRVSGKKGEESVTSNIASFRTLLYDISLADDATNTTVIDNNNGSKVNVTIGDRLLFKDGDWNTLCLPFDMNTKQIAASSLAGAKLMEFDGTTSGYDEESGTLTLNFNKANYITAGKPYLVKYLATPIAGTDYYNNLYKLTDGDTSTKWCALNNYTYTFSAEIVTPVPISVTSYTMTTADDAEDYWWRNPVVWTLKAKLDDDDEWTLIDSRNAQATPDDALPTANFAAKTYSVNKTGTYQYFLLDITQTGGWSYADGHKTQLSELKINGTSEGTPNPTFPGVTINSAAPLAVTSSDNKVSFTGSYTAQSFDKEDRSVLFLGASNTLYYPVAGASINAFRAYFQLHGLAAAPNDGGQSGVRAFVLNFGDHAETTQGIETLTSGPARGGEDSGYYTLDGTKLDKAPTRKGIYIQNGRKVVIK